MSGRPSVLPSEEAFEDFKKQCLASENWVNKYDKNGMQVWIEVPANKGSNASKVHKIKVNAV